MATILIVDDRPTNRQFLSTLLGYGGHELFEAADGAEALRLTREKRPDLVITDILMPTMDGFEYAKSVRGDPAIAATKIVFYTATYRATEAALLAKACGVSVVIAKPAEPQRVLDVVHQQLGLAPLQVVPRKGEKPANSDEESEPELSRLGVELADHVNDLKGLRAQFDAILERSKVLEQERERLRGISTRFSETTARLHSSSTSE
jgi:CheY-like chemotaxis protein